MVKINKPSIAFNAKALFRYRGNNYKHLQEKRFENITIKEIDYNLKEELLITKTMFDGTQVMFSMISSNMYLKENGNYKLKEEQNFCDFELYFDENYMVFEGNISYMNYINLDFEYRESFETTIILAFNKKLFDIWVKHGKIIN